MFNLFVDYSSQNLFLEILKNRKILKDKGWPFLKVRTLFLEI